MDQETKDSVLLHRLAMETGKVEAIDLGQLSDSEWGEIIQKSLKHGIAPLLYDHFKKNSNIPNSAMQRLRSIYLQNAIKNTRLYDRLTRALRALKEEDIPVVILKGAALAELLYQNIALRPMVDIDLLIKGQDMWRANEVLTQLGYDSDVGLLHSRRAIKWCRHVIYQENNFWLEVHPRIAEIPKCDPWIKAIPTQIASNDVFILGPEDFLLHLCIHFEHHLHGNSSQLISLYDIAEILKRYGEEIDWDYMVKTSKKNRIGEAVYRTLCMTSKWLDSFIPMDALNQLKNDGMVISANDILNPDQIHWTIPRDTSPVHYFPILWTIPTISGKAYHIFRKVFPSREFMINNYSIEKPGLVYFYYLVRTFAVPIETVKIFCSQLFSRLKSRLK